MDASYSFNINNEGLEKGIKRLRLGLILFVTSTILMLISSILLFFTDGLSYYGGMSVVGSWFFELFVSILMIISSFLMFYGLESFASNIGGQSQKKLDISRYLFLALICLLIPLKILALILHLATEFPVYLVGINFILYALLSAALFSISLNFNYLKRNGFAINIQYTALVALPVPAVLGFVLGLVGMIASYWGDLDMLGVVMELVYFYMAIALTAAFWEMYLTLRKTAREMNIEFAPQREKKPRKTKKAEKKIKEKKEKPAIFEQATPAKK